MKKMFFVTLMMALPFLNSCKKGEELEKAFEEEKGMIECSVSFEDVDFTQLSSENDTLRISLMPEVVGGKES